MELVQPMGVKLTVDCLAINFLFYVMIFIVFELSESSSACFKALIFDSEWERWDFSKLKNKKKETV